MFSIITDPSTKLSCQSKPFTDCNNSPYLSHFGNCYIVTLKLFKIPTVLQEHFPISKMFCIRHEVYYLVLPEMSIEILTHRKKSINSKFQ